MAKQILFIVMVVACILVSLSEAKRWKKKMKKDKKVSHDDDSIDTADHLKQLQASVDELKATVTQLQEQHNFHFFFHDGHGHDHHEDNGTHVHVHLEHHDDHEDHDGHQHHIIHHTGDSSEDTDEEHLMHAICCFKNDKVQGHVYIEQKESDKYAKFSFEFDHIGNANEEFPLHVHENGDLTDDCKNVGPHFNPYNEYRDVGDLGHLTANNDGAVPRITEDTMLTLFGHYSVIGRSITVHNANKESIACCVIGINGIGEVGHD